MRRGRCGGWLGADCDSQNFWTEIVAQASNYDEPTTLHCRRRLGRRPCGGLLTLFFDVDSFDAPATPISVSPSRSGGVAPGMDRSPITRANPDGRKDQ